MPLHQLPEAFLIVLAREAPQELSIRQTGRAGGHSRKSSIAVPTK
jgi:hypothetical protein